MRHLKPLFISLWGRPLLKSHSVVDQTRGSIMHPARVLIISNTPMVPDNNVSNAARTLHPRTDSKSSNNLSYLIHEGRAVDMIKRCVSIEGLSLSKGWTTQATQAFKVAIEAVVRANPILTGKLIEVKNKPWPWIHRGELRVIPNVFPPEKHSFVTAVDPPPRVATPGQAMHYEMGDESANDLFHYVHSNVAKYLVGEASFSADQIRDGSPLFEAKIMDFGDGHAAYSIKVSHAIGDGTTYFQLISQISSFMNGRTPPKIDWDNPLKATHEIYPENFSERDYQRSYGLPFGWGIFKNLRTLSKRQCTYLLLSKEKIAEKKKVLRQTEADNGGSISANDIIMSCLCEMCGSSDIFAFDRSVRGIKEGVSKSSAGNFFWEIPFEREHGENPFEIRNILSSDKGSYFDTNGVPLLPFLSGRVGRITNLASIAHSISFPGTESICQLPSASFIKDLPLDVAVIFRFDKNHWGVMHNFRKVNKSPLLREIMA